MNVMASDLVTWMFTRRFCKEKHNIVFLKVHKTGSSTMANIITRFGINRKLNIALPNKTQGTSRYNYFGRVGETLSTSGMKPSKRNAKKYNILCNHVIFNWGSFNSIFPRNQTTYVTMLRDPVTQFKSSLLYFQHGDIFTAATENLTAYLEHPEYYEPNDPYRSFTDNRQALDLGLPTTKLRNPTFIARYIKILEKSFDLVLIMEYFDESLILLRRRMCWTMKDVLYIRKNSAYKQFDFQIGEYEKSLLKNWSRADTMIYDHFYKKFHILLKKDPSVMEEAHWFKMALAEAQTFCSGSTSQSKLRIDSSPWNLPFYVTSFDCMYMRLRELQFLDKLLHDA